MACLTTTRWIWRLLLNALRLIIAYSSKALFKDETDKFKDGDAVPSITQILGANERSTLA